MSEDLTFQQLVDNITALPTFNLISNGHLFLLRETLQLLEVQPEFQNLDLRQQQAVTDCLTAIRGINYRMTSLDYNPEKAVSVNSAFNKLKQFFLTAKI